MRREPITVKIDSVIILIYELSNLVGWQTASTHFEERDVLTAPECLRLRMAANPPTK